MSKQPWALILGASSGFGEATALELARTGMNIFGVHLDRRGDPPHVEQIGEKIRARLITPPPGTLRVLMHSLASGSLLPLTGAEQVASRSELESTADLMGHSLVYWVQDCLRAGLFDWGGRIFAMTSAGGAKAVPNYGPVGVAKAMIEAHIRQLAMELAPA